MTNEEMLMQILEGIKKIKDLIILRNDLKK